MRTFLSVVSFIIILLGAFLSLSFLSSIVIFLEQPNEVSSPFKWFVGGSGLGGITLLVIGLAVNSHKKRKYPIKDSLDSSTEEKEPDESRAIKVTPNKAVSFIGIPLFLIVAIIFLSYRHSIFLDGKFYDLDSRFVTYYTGWFFFSALMFTAGLYAILRTMIRRAHLYPATMLFFVMAMQTAVFRFSIEKYETHNHFEIQEVTLVVLAIGLLFLLGRKIFDS